VRSIADLYTLGADELAEYERMGGTSAAKLVQNLRARNQVSLAEFIAGFDIEGIGILMVEKATHAGFSSLEALRSAGVEELAAIEGFADIMARTLHDGLAFHAAAMDEVLATGAVSIREAAPDTGPLSGMSFCFTGELLTMKRSRAEALVKSLGGSVRSSVAKGLSYLVTNDPLSGSSKNKKAAGFGVAIIDENAFLELAGQH
jgi:DNA ligase (NAD+)